MKLFPSGCHALFIFCMMSVARGARSEAGAPAAWRFSNFGLHAAGTVTYGTNTISISTRYTRHCFFDSDHYSFAYQVWPFPYDDCSSLTVTVKINTVIRGSAGIMIRSDSSLGAANVHLETSATGEIFLFYRKTKDDQTSYTHLATLSFPLELKLVRQGNAFTPWYKQSNEWMKGNPVMVAAGSQMLTGFYACSGEEFQTGMAAGAGKEAKAVFSDYRFGYEENYIPPVQDYHDTTPVSKDVLLKDNFDDGSLSNGPAAVNNPIWQGIEYGYLPVDPRGGRYWKKTGDGVFYLGDKKWTDYQFSIDLLFDKNNEAKAECTILLRHQDIAVYSKMERYYAVTFRNGNKLIFEKNIPGQGLFSRTTMLPGYFDGKWHRLKVRLLDRNYEIYYDDRMIVEGVDTLQPVTYGNTGLRFTNVSVGLDNLEVKRITDPVNGDLDNYLMDYFDTPIPAYLDGFIPRLFQVTTAETRPGDAVLVRGEYIDQVREISVCRLPDDPVDDKAPAYVPLPAADALPDAQGTNRRTEPQLPGRPAIVDRLLQNRQSLKFILPRNGQPGIYSVRLKDSKGRDMGFYLNIPRVNWVISEEGLHAVAGDYLRVQGKNLRGIANKEQIALVSADGKRIVHARVNSVLDDYSISVNIPADMPAGHYTLYYHNGWGGTTAWSEPLKIEVTAKPVTNATQKTFNVQDYGAKGDGLNNETAAFRAALHAADSAGGGIVYAPRGRYVLTGELMIPPYTTLRGESKALTQLVWSPLNWEIGELPNSLISGTHHFGVKDLNIWATRAWGIIMSTGQPKEQGNITLENLVVRQTPMMGGIMYDVKANRDKVEAELKARWNKSGIVLRGPNLKVRNCTFNSNGFYIFSAASGFIQRCRFERVTTGINQPYMAVHPKGLIFEDCYKQADGYGYAATIDESHDLYEARNVVPYDYTNDREVMTLDGGGGAYAGKIGGIENKVLMLPKGAGTYQWTPDKWVGGGVFIIEGKGAGQYRRIVHHTLDSIILDQPFLVDPDASSIISITTIRKNLFFIDNEASDGGAYQLYGSAQNVVIAGLKLLRCDGVVSRGSFLYHGKQPNWYVEIVGCTLREGNYSHWFGVDDRHSGYQNIDLIGTGGGGLNIGTLVRRNKLFDFTYIRTSPGIDHDAVTDAIIEDNSITTAKKAILLGGAADNTSHVLIHNNHYKDVEKQVEIAPGLRAESNLILEDGVTPVQEP